VLKQLLSQKGYACLCQVAPGWQGTAGNFLIRGIDAMSNGSHASQLVSGPLSTIEVRACLIQLGWQIDLAGERAITATQSRTADERQEYSAIVCWQARDNDFQVTVRVETSDKQSKIDCDMQIQKLLDAIGRATPADD